MELLVILFLYKLYAHINLFISKFKVKSKHNKNNKTKLNEDLSIRQTALQKLFIFATPNAKRKEPKNINQNF